MAIDGYKTLSHETLVAYLKEFYKEFAEHEIIFIDQLRQLRNKIVYKGFFVEKSYLDRNENRIKEIVAKLRKLLERSESLFRPPTRLLPAVKTQKSLGTTAGK